MIPAPNGWDALWMLVLRVWPFVLGILIGCLVVAVAILITVLLVLR